MRYVFIPVLGVFGLGGCSSTMDQAGKFAVDFTNQGGDPLVAGFYLLMNSFSDEAARARVAEAVSSFLSTLQQAVQPISEVVAPGIGVGEASLIGGGIGTAVLAAIRMWRGPASTRQEKETLTKAANKPVTSVTQN